MEQPGGTLQNGALLRSLSPADADRAARTLRKLARHDIGRWALTGGLAIEFHCASARALNDLDFVAPAFDSIPESLAGDFLFRHVHPFDPSGKIILQFIDAGTGLRIDVFRACGDTLRRAVTAEFPSGPMPIASAADLLARAARLLLGLADGVAVAAKHASDYLRLVEIVDPAEMEVVWPDHRKPSHPAEFREARRLIGDLVPACSDLLVTPRYSRDTSGICPRCIPTAAFPLADPKVVLAILGHC